MNNVFKKNANHWDINRLNFQEQKNKSKMFAERDEIFVLFLRALGNVGLIFLEKTSANKMVTNITLSENKNEVKKCVVNRTRSKRGEMGHI